MRNVWVVCGFFVPFILPNIAWAATYTVSIDGDDNSIGSSDEPWATLQHAADSVQPGDTVIVTEGIYSGFNLTRSGTATDSIAFLADPGVTIDQDNNDTPDGINLEGASYVTIDGFKVIGATRAGFRCAQAEFVTFSNNVAENNGRWGIFTGFCDDLLIENNNCSGSVDEHGVYVSNSADRPIVRGNILWNNNANGLHMNGDLSMGGDGLIESAIVENNVIYGNGAAGGSAINCDGCQNARIFNNLIYDTHASGISLYAIDATEGSKSNQIYNNTVIVASDGRWCLNIQDASTGNQAYNNILLNEHGFRGSIDISQDSLEGWTSDYNVVMDRFTIDGGSSVLTLAEWRSATGQGANSLIATAADLFVSGSDFHLRSGSIAIDKGSAAHAPESDLDKIARPQLDGVDIGAYEYCEGSCEGGDAGTGGTGANKTDAGDDPDQTGGSGAGGVSGTGSDGGIGGGSGSGSSSTSGTGGTLSDNTSGGNGALSTAGTSISDTGGVPATDADSSSATCSGGSGDCGCRLGSRSTNGSWLYLLACVLFWLRRRMR